MRVCSFLFSLAEKIRFLSAGLFLLKAFFYSGTHAYYRFSIDIFSFGSRCTGQLLDITFNLR
ncbi:hypothetical protein AAW12_06470 [Sphingobacterium sp. Ag1]|nr:hypothetical protein AAW12_06470 [Sphingobacterium sp. Ag1]